jgi:hypothetical protein
MERNLPGGERYKWSRYVGFEVFRVVIMKNAVFWVMAPCISCVNWLLPPLHVVSWLGDFSTMKMKAIRSSETSVHIWSTRRHFPEVGILHGHVHFHPSKAAIGYEFPSGIEQMSVAFCDALYNRKLWIESSYTRKPTTVNKTCPYTASNEVTYEDRLERRRNVGGWSPSEGGVTAYFLQMRALINGRQNYSECYRQLHNV